MLIETSKKNAICFDNSYVLLGSRFYASVKPTPVERPCIVKLNYGLALSVTILGATLYGILAGNTALNDMAALREDMDEETKNTNYGVSVLSAPLPVFRVILFIVYLAIAVTQLMMLHG